MDELWVEVEEALAGVFEIDIEQIKHRTCGDLGLCGETLDESVPDW